MSQLNLIIIKNNRLYFSKCGYRFLLNLLNKKFKFLNKFLNIIKTKYYYDSGYFLIDFDNKVIFSNQSSFSSTDINHDIRISLKKEFDFHEMF